MSDARDCDVDLCGCGNEKPPELPTCYTCMEKVDVCDAFVEPCSECIRAEGNSFPDETCAIYPILKILAEAVEISEPKVTYRSDGISKFNEMVAFWVRRA